MKMADDDNQFRGLAVDVIFDCFDVLLNIFTGKTCLCSKMENIYCVCVVQLTILSLSFIGRWDC